MLVTSAHFPGPREWFGLLHLGGFQQCCALHPKAVQLEGCQQCLGTCRTWGFTQECKSALQSFNLFFGLAWASLKVILALHVGWAGGKAGGEGLAEMSRENSTCRALGTKAVPSCLSKQPLCIASVSHTAHPSAPTWPVLWEKPVLVLHIQEECHEPVTLWGMSCQPRQEGP